jgi:hypothetical protein
MLCSITDITSVVFAFDLKYYNIIKLVEQIACAARVVLQTGCEANVVSIINTVIFSSLDSLTFLRQGLYLGC